MYQIFKISANHTVDFAADELKKYLRMLMPDCGEISVSSCPDASEGLRIGLMSDFGLDTSDAEDLFLDDIVYIDTDENGGIIAGSNPVATLIAIYRYLRFQGCRWLRPSNDGEWIPIKDSLVPVNYRKKADYRYRGNCNEGAEFQYDMMDLIDFLPKIGLNTFMIEFKNPYVYYNCYYSHTYSTAREPEPVHRDTVLQWKRQCEVELQKRSIHFHDMGHGWTAEPFGLDSTAGWTEVEGAEDSITEETRQYLAMMNGKRGLYTGRPLCTNICMSNPKARRIMVKAVADYAEHQSNVGYNNFSLADARNNICECEECRKKRPSDWYVILLNELDEEMTRRNLDMKIVFSVYANTFWAPETEKIKNPNRFLLEFAPIWRTYEETYEKDPAMDKIAPFVLNDLILPHGMSETIAYLHKWNENWDGDCFCYEYHFMDMHYSDPSSMYIAKLLYDDVRTLKKHNIKGMIEDGTQRCFFPTGFPFYVYGETLFDSSVDFEDLKEDFFSHAFGDNWKEVVNYLETIRDLLPFSYFHHKGKEPKYEGKSHYYDPDMKPMAAKVHDLVKEFAPVIKANKIQYYRASTVSWQLLEFYNNTVDKIATVVENKCVGNEAETVAAIDALFDYTAHYEIYFERYFEFFQFCRYWDGVTEGYREKLAFDNMNI